MYRRNIPPSCLIIVELDFCTYAPIHYYSPPSPMIVRGWTNILRDIFLASTVSRRDSHPPSSSATSEYLLYSACPPSTSAMDLWIFRKMAMMLTVFSAKKFSASLSVSSLVFVPNVQYVTKLGKKLVPRLTKP